MTLRWPGCGCELVSDDERPAGLVSELAREGMREEARRFAAGERRCDRCQQKRDALTAMAMGGMGSLMATYAKQQLASIAERERLQAEQARPLAATAAPILPRLCRSADELLPGMWVVTSNSWGTHVVERSLDDAYPYLVYADGPSAGDCSVGGAALAEEIANGRVTILAEAADMERAAGVLSRALANPGVPIDTGSSSLTYLPASCRRCNSAPCEYSCPAGGWARYESERKAAAEARAKREEEARERSEREPYNNRGGDQFSGPAARREWAEAREASAAAERPFMHVVR